MGEEDVEGRENAARCFFSDKTPPHPCGVSLVRFLPTWARNEHNKLTDKSNFKAPCKQGAFTIKLWSNSQRFQRRNPRGGHHDRFPR